MEHATQQRCIEGISRIEPIYRFELINRLAYERFERKYRDIVEIYHRANDNWGQTFHEMLFRVVGGTSNKLVFQELARRVTHTMVQRENNSIVSLEALLLGTAGLLDLYGEDDYIRHLKSDFEHLRIKYNITPLSLKDWRLKNIYPHNHPTLRITQLASCLHNGTITMSSVTACRRRRDVYRLFTGRSSEYWVERFMPNASNLDITRRMGQFKSDLMGINFVAQIAFAYGSYTQSNRLIDNATALLEDIPAEDNRYIKAWNSVDAIARNAYESQALLQLSTEYCIKGRCEECPLTALLKHHGV